jgi:hypothetical protein
MKRHTVILPFLLPRLTDKAAAQFIELLHELIGGIEHHYAPQVHRYHKRQQQIQQNQPWGRSAPPSPIDPPF